MGYCGIPTEEALRPWPPPAKMWIRRNGWILGPSRAIVVLDRVHDHVTLMPVVAAAVDTPWFQRLRGLKQLGVSCYLYPSAVHTRFEHSIGVSHLAERFVESIRDRQPELQLTDSDVRCVAAAGLSHDLGHGPFSHLFEDVVMPRRQQERHDSGGCQTASSSVSSPLVVRFDHEDMSQRLARRMFAGILDTAEIDGTCALMRGDDVAYDRAARAWRGGQGDDEARDTSTNNVRHVPLSELVSNKCSFMDVDKLDYLLRDSQACFGKTSSDIRLGRLLPATRVLPTQQKNGSSGVRHVCFEQKMAATLRDIFQLRAKLHKFVYQHRVVKCIGHMVGDALAAGEPHILIAGMRMSELVRHGNEEAYCQLGDWILDAIAVAMPNNSPNPTHAMSELTAAQWIVGNLRRRRLYPVVLQTVLPSASMDPQHPLHRVFEEASILGWLEAEWLRRYGTAPEARRTSMTCDPVMLVASTMEAGRGTVGGMPSHRHLFIVDVVSIHHGAGNRDPLASCWFYNPKEDSNQLTRDGGSGRTAYRLPPAALEEGAFASRHYAERSLFIFVRGERDDIDVARAREVARAWQLAHLQGTLVLDTNTF